MKLHLPACLLAGLLSLLLCGCSKKTETNSQKDPPTDNSVLNYIKGLGFPASRITDAGDEYVVEDDIIFPKDMPSHSGPTTEHYYTGYLVSPANRTNIRIFLDTTLNELDAQFIANVLTQAVNTFNTVPHTNLHFSVVTSGPYDIFLTADYLYFNTCIKARYPLNGAAGSRLVYNLSAPGEFAQRTIIHGLGHCIGLRHTNWVERGEPWNGTDDIGTPGHAYNIPGVGDQDFLSIMNGGECFNWWPYFTVLDSLAIAVLYPSNPPITRSGRIIDMVSIEVDTSNVVHFFSNTGWVTKGLYNQVNGPTNAYSIRGGMEYIQVVGMAIDSLNTVYTWYDDGTFSSGTIYDQDTYVHSQPFTLAPGRTIESIVAMTIDKRNNKCYTYYNNGIASIGTPADLDAYGTFSYEVPMATPYSEVSDVTILSNGTVYVWYKNTFVMTAAIAQLGYLQEGEYIDE